MSCRFNAIASGFIFIAMSLIMEASHAQAWFGTAFAIGDGYTYVTNEHVVSGAKSICFRTHLGESGRAKVISSDKADDLVILRGNIHSPPLVLGTSQEIEKGMSVVAIGYPVPSIMGLEAKVTEGIVNALSGVGGDRRRIQVSAPIQPGNSGGPLLSDTGRVVGVVVSRLGKRFTEATGQVADSVGYGINIARLRALIDTTPPIPQLLTASTSKVPISKTKLVAQAEPSVVLVVASEKNESCASDYDVEIPEFGFRAKTRQEVERERKELERIAQARVALERAEIERKERESIAAKLDEERRQRESILAREELEDKRRRTVRDYVDDLIKSHPGVRIIESSPGFSAWRVVVKGVHTSKLQDLTSVEQVSELVNEYIKMLGLSLVELTGGFGSETFDKLRGRDILVRGDLRTIDVRYRYGIAHFSSSPERISHLVLGVEGGVWHVIEASKSTTLASSSGQKVGTSAPQALAVSFNTPSVIDESKGLTVFGLDELRLRNFHTKK
jgi:hypothetical protein